MISSNRARSSSSLKYSLGTEVSQELLDDLQTDAVAVPGPWHAKWGNPFVIGRDGTRVDVIERYEAWLLTQPDPRAALPELAGKTLGCWCAPCACHGDVLARLANAPAT